MKAARKFPRGTSGGGSGLTPTHLLQLLQAPRADRPHGLQKALVALVNQLAQGEGPRALAVWIAGAPITPLRKDDGGVRPIAVGETIRCLVSSMQLQLVIARAKKILAPIQQGVAVPGGIEAATHAVRALAWEHRDDDGLALLQIDLQNAFNVANRAAVRHEVRMNLPSLRRWVTYCYGPDTQPELWSGDLRLRSVCGVQQGTHSGPSSSLSRSTPS